MRRRRLPAILSLALLMACGRGATPPGPVAPSGTVPVAAGQTFAVVASYTGTTQLVGTITSVRRETDVADATGRRLAAGGTFAIITIRLTNDGSSPESACGGFQLRDDRGRKFDHAPDAEAALAPPTGTRRPMCAVFEPGLSYEVVAVFDIPADTAQLSLLPTPP